MSSVSSSSSSSTPSPYQLCLEEVFGDPLADDQDGEEPPVNRIVNLNRQIIPLAPPAAEPFHKAIKSKRKLEKLEWQKLCQDFNKDQTIALLELIRLSGESEESLSTYLEKNPRFCVYSNPTTRHVFNITAIWKKECTKYLRKDWALKFLQDRLKETRSPTPPANQMSKVIPRSLIRFHNRRMVPVDQIPAKLIEASRFAKESIAPLETPVFNVGDRIASYDSFYAYKPVLVSQAGADFKSPINDSRPLLPLLSEILNGSLGHAYTKGRRDYNEDTAVATILKSKCPTTGSDTHTPFFGIFDGHGGEQCSKFLADVFPDVIGDFLFRDFSRVEQDINSLAYVFNFLKYTFPFLSDEFRKRDTQMTEAGSTATVAFPYNGYWYIACCGDSTAVRSKNGEAIALSVDAQPDVQRDPKHMFLRDIMKRGGCVNYIWGDGWETPIDCMVTERRRVNMTRSLGHSEDNSVSGINPRPKITHFAVADIASENDFLIIASDGLWGFVNPKEAAHIVQDLASKGESLDKIAEALVKIALLRNSNDNITVLVVDLTKC